MAKRLRTTVHINRVTKDEDGNPVFAPEATVFGPDDRLPDWAVEHLDKTWGAKRPDLWGDDGEGGGGIDLGNRDAVVRSWESGRGFADSGPAGGSEILDAAAEGQRAARDREANARRRAGGHAPIGEAEGDDGGSSSSEGGSEDSEAEQAKGSRSRS